MREKYIFFTLCTIALVLLIGASVGKKTENEIGPKERALDKKTKRLSAKKIALPEKIDIEKVQDLIAFSSYEGMLKRSPFSKVKLKQPKPTQAKRAVLPVEESTPEFLYKGKIVAGNRLVVIIEETRTGRVSMVSKGDTVDGYKVLDILDTEVILSKKGEENIVLQTIEGPRGR